MSTSLADSGMVLISIRDTGPGIEPAIRDRIFDPFFTTKAPGSGTGLGLNIVYRIMTRCRGTIQARNAAENGAVFRLQFGRHTQD